MNPRALTLLVLFATQALASGVTSVVHLCTKTSRPNACRCPGKKPPEGVQKTDCCISKVLRGERPLPSTARLEAPSSDVTPAVAPLLAWLPLRERNRDPIAHGMWSPATPAQGPPLYVRLRSFLN